MEEIQNEPLLGSKDIESQKEVKPKRRYYWVAALCVGIGLIVGTTIGFISFHKTTSTTQTTIGTTTVGTASNGLNTDFNSLTIYQIMVSSFQGDGSSCYCTGYGPSSHRGNLKGIINALDYIKGLNVNAIWLTPVFDSTGGTGGSLLQSTGYFATDYFNVDPKFGSNDDLRNLIRGCHDRGMYIFLDGVFGHHGGNVKGSPSGKYPQGGSNPVSYPGSLDFYKEVATYWIREYEIDGWRLDQCYQVYQNGHNYWHEIREAVQSVCNERKSQGKQWGTLGYMVGEHWSGASEIQSQTYSQDGLKSAFDFPSRYNLVQVIAQEESGAGGYGVGTLTNVFKTPSEKGYSSDVYPNLFITNHDVWRFGNLIRNKYGYDRSNPSYWKRYKIALGCLAAYTGPITIYYGDEVGDIADCWQSYGCGGNTAGDNVARTDGHISGFNNNEQDLHDYTAKIMSIRQNYPAMWRGSNSVSTKDGALINVKWDSQTQTKIVFVVNTGTSPTTVYVNCGGSSFKDLISGQQYSGNGGFNLNCDALTCYIFEAK
ncbi:Alpha amylase, catalytic domain containing protein [Histomonas meleagridis]|uniref:Alpha amylase, catalytic domain containing protein n=1 Tax=Histomonas meleagridis TaxID=135588 RepID=UPI0035594817|nr:Alpha amylase, catalytic domain containing protein [Histomonas meleagridis]KAH0802101.1 Alpha amylase, catalytic domain containing protein [Histomonas meleagridis]